MRRLHLGAFVLAIFLRPELIAAASEDKEINEPCTLHSPNTNSFYDLRPLAVLPPEPGKTTGTDQQVESWHAKGYDYQANFTLNLCAPVVENMTDIVGVEENLWRNVSAYYEFKGKNYSIGQQSSEPVFRGRKLVLNYTDGSPCDAELIRPSELDGRAPTLKRDEDGKTASKDDDEDDDKEDDDDDKKDDKKGKDSKRRKSSLISLLCERDPLAPPVAVSFVGASPDECTYFFEARAHAACGGARDTKQGMGPGGVFGVLALIAVLVYVLGGCVYQRTVMHARGWRQLPNYSMWAGIGVFLRDTFIILTSSCARLIPQRRGYSTLSASGANGGVRRSSRNEDENRLIDQLDEEWEELDCQNDLSASITKLNKKSKLLVIREGPTTLLPKLFKAWKITHLVFEKDSDPYAKDRDDEVVRASKDAGVQVVTRVGRTLYDPDELVKKNGGKPTMSISQVMTAGSKIGEIAKPIAAPTSLPDPGDTKLDFDQERPASTPDLNAAQRDREDESYSKLAGPKGDFSVPTLKELGLKEASGPHSGGETVGLKMLQEVLNDKVYTATFEKPNTAPTAFEPQATTLMSPYLHFGSISCREFYWRVQDVVNKFKGKASQPPTSLTGQLLFRDMYFGAQAKLGHEFGQTVGNSHCRFIPWHLPSKIDQQSGLYTGEYSIDSPEAEEWLRRWKYGCTGFPWIDALMRQLRQEGWIHHLGRHAVACFLTRGGCYIDWQRGADVFEEWLIDHEPACNVGNWQWLSCTAFYAQFYRCYSPVAFPQKWDKEGDFVRRYVPELKEYPKKYIYEPWKCPIADQKKAGCVIKGDGAEEKTKHEESTKVYPKPMFDFGERRTICMDGMKSAYHVNLYGNSPKVLDGTWKSLFDDAAEGPTEGEQACQVPNGGLEGSNGMDTDDHAAAASGDDAAEEKLNKGRSKRKRGQGTLDGHVKKSKKQ
ncbi:MAG: hypothetical protein M1837_003454 [Sclerophora amabilis]|nr:MAG: hypothetical protein M1837_003454 [Sclerophora amabilis]